MCCFNSWDGEVPVADGPRLGSLSFNDQFPTIENMALGWGESQTHGMPTGYHEDVYIYIHQLYMYIYICRELGFTDTSDNLDAWNGLKLSETALRSVLIGNRSRNSLDERKQCENSPKQPWYSADIKTTRKKWKEFWLAKQPIPNFKLCISPGAETHSGRCKKMGVLNLGGRWRAAYVTWPPRI